MLTSLQLEFKVVGEYVILPPYPPGDVIARLLLPIFQYTSIPTDEIQLLSVLATQSGSAMAAAWTLTGVILGVSHPASRIKASESRHAPGSRIR